MSITGGLLVLFGLGSIQAFQKVSQPTGKLGEAVKGSFQQAAIQALSSISTSIEHVILIFGIAYLVLGLGTLLILRFTKPKKPAPESDKKGAPLDEPKEETINPEMAPKPIAKPAPNVDKSKKDKILVKKFRPLMK